MFYFIMNVFPYSGFMALHLLNRNINMNNNNNNNNNINNGDDHQGGDDEDEQHEHEQHDPLLYYTAATIGPYAGVIASAFQIGRVPSAILWGKCADIYGRNFVMVVSLVSTIIGSLLFGLSTSYTMAVAVRFFTGVMNGTMIVARTQISELAKGDSGLESKGVGVLMSMVGYG